MEIINSEVQYLPQEEFITGMYKQIEKCGRICYKSEDGIKEGTAEKFVHHRIIEGHYAMLEHGTIYLTVIFTVNDFFQIKRKYERNPYSHVNCTYSNDGRCPEVLYITTNLRVIEENNWYKDLIYMKEPTWHHERRITLRFITSIGITRELIRHRVMSFANESTRYCNYNRSKFGKELTFIKPHWCKALGTFKNENSIYKDYQGAEALFLCNLLRAERDYMSLTNKEEGYSLNPQDARELLPLATKSDIVVTGFVKDWKHFFDLRLFGKTGKPHPDMFILAEMAKNELQKNNLWGLIYLDEEN